MMKSMVQIPEFVHEIDIRELQVLQAVGRGSFGVVSMGKWRGHTVAIKHIETEREREAFLVEVSQLARVCHDNIVQLFGACTKEAVCLVMEYAEGGSLYNVLHGVPAPVYSAAHAISWMLQCARGVAYLHDMKPRALVHRDLKPPNLLLCNGGMILKICDFGTACDMKTNMTNAKGSAAWMAPEVIVSTIYSEKCDVYSWGIILWQVLTRRKPFHEVGGAAYQIMWKVANGLRPPPISNCPKPLEWLMTTCWDQEPTARPAMARVVEHMEELCGFFPGANNPIIYPAMSLEDQARALEKAQAEDEMLSNDSFLSSHSPITFYGQRGESRQITLDPMANMTPLSLNLQDCSNPIPPAGGPLYTAQPPYPIHAPAGSYFDSLSHSQSSPVLKRRSVDSSPVTPHALNKARGHRRSASYGSTSSSGGGGNVFYLSDRPSAESTMSEEQVFESAYLLLDPELRPVEPCLSVPESVDLFERHKRLASDFLRIQSERTYLKHQGEELDRQLRELESKEPANTPQMVEEYYQLEAEKADLERFRNNLRNQLKILRNGSSS
ncbi:unnamed protein product [Cyprideis torosa]|uniref:Mitogen-activated protein kinase kinase kinase 7 n=1 Tax=Cyprideis torosa TaxID=163714 RepID=A0A7R8W586_9CRUS|nr:unnamed protein product [Cyprideis torosa]CAG0881444.1 unnamed protein product [Cyprideis torosa]